MPEFNSFYSRKVSFPNIPWMEAYEAENWPKNELGQLVYRARNSDITRRVTYDNYYWVDSNKNHIPFFTNEIQIGVGAPTESAPSLGPFVYLDSSTGVIYSWENTTNTWIMVTGGSLNIYNSNGTLSGNRDLDGNGFNLIFNDLNNFAVDTVQSILNATTSITLNSPITKLSVLPVLDNTNTKVLVRNTITGNIEEREVSSFTDIEFQDEDNPFGNLSDFQYLNVVGAQATFSDQGGGVARLRIQPQDLSGTTSSSDYTVNISNGSSIAIPLVTTLLAGLMSPADKIKLNNITVTQAVDLDYIEAALFNLNILTGVSPTNFDLGTFTGTTITNNVTIKTALQELETAVETKQNRLQWQEEGVNIGGLGIPTIINFTGAGATASFSGATVTIDIPGGGGGGQAGLQIQNEGVNLGTSGTVTSIDFTGDLQNVTRTVNSVLVRTPNIGDYLQMTSLDPVNDLKVKLGALVTNWVESTTTGKIIDLNIPDFTGTWNPSTGLGKSSIILFKGASPTIWASLLGGEEGKWVKVINLSNTLLLLENDSTSGTASARFINSIGRAVPILPHQSIDLLYTSGRWYMTNLPTYDIWDDFTGVPASVSAATWLTSTFGSITTSTSPGTGITSDNRSGVIAIDAGIGGRATVGELTNNKSLPNSVGLFYWDRFAFNSAPGSNSRISRGFNKGVSTNWTFASGANIEGGSLIYFPDSGKVNAATNWFYYVGNGTLADFVANSTDSGLSIASTSTGVFMNLIVYSNSTNFDVTFIHSLNNRDYIIGTNINKGTPLGSVSGSIIHSRISSSGNLPGADWLCLHTSIKTFR